jgi:hypothetical protein
VRSTSYGIKILLKNANPSGPAALSAIIYASLSDPNAFSAQYLIMCAFCIGFVRTIVMKNSNKLSIASVNISYGFFYPNEVQIISDGIGEH